MYIYVYTQIWSTVDTILPLKPFAMTPPTRLVHWEDGEAIVLDAHLRDGLNLSPRRDHRPQIECTNHIIINIINQWLVLLWLVSKNTSEKNILTSDS